MVEIGTYRGIRIKLDGRGSGVLYATTNRNKARVQVAKVGITGRWADAYTGLCRAIDLWLDGSAF